MKLNPKESCNYNNIHKCAIVQVKLLLQRPLGSKASSGGEGGQWCEGWMMVSEGWAIRSMDMPKVLINAQLVMIEGTARHIPIM